MKHAGQRREDEGLLLDALLAEPARRREARASLRASRRGRSRLRALETLLARARRTMGAAGLAAEREEQLVERVLVATTRRSAPRTPADPADPADPGRRRGASARRALVALAAALLLVGGLTLLRSRIPAPVGEPSSVALGSEAGQASPALGSPSARSLPDDGPQGVLERAREELAASASAHPRGELRARDPRDPQRIELRLLEERARGLRERRWDGWLRTLPLSRLAPLAQALWCEVQLDRYALTGELPPAWDRALAVLQRSARSGGEQAAEGSRLLSWSLARAQAYGLADAPPPEGLTLAGAAPAATPWADGWFDQLASAGREAGISDAGTWRAWVEWGGP